jgi:CHAT domain-containing protein
MTGISWAFMAAGCPTTVASQWRAESHAVNAMMVEFHRRLLRGDTAAEALRQAQLLLMRRSRYRDPIYWAPFVVIGAP